MGSELFRNGGDLAVILEIALRNLLNTELMQKAYYLEFRMTDWTEETR